MIDIEMAILCWRPAAQIPLSAHNLSSQGHVKITLLWSQNVIRVFDPK